MKRLMTVALMMCLARSGWTDPGNLVSWYNSAQNEITFTCQTAVVRLSMLDTNVARVRQTPTGTPFSTSASYTVIKNWPLPAMSVTDGSSMTITTSGLRVDVQKTPLRFTFRKPD